MDIRSQEKVIVIMGFKIALEEENTNALLEMLRKIKKNKEAFSQLTEGMILEYNEFVHSGFSANIINSGISLWYCVASQRMYNEPVDWTELERTIVELQGLVFN